VEESDDSFSEYHPRNKKPSGRAAAKGLSKDFKPSQDIDI
jgi:hypothetical protein